MQHWQQPGLQGTFASSVRSSEAERAFFTSVFGWMGTALAITGFTAYATASTPALFNFVMSSQWLFFIPTLAMAFIFPSVAPRLPAIANGALLGLFAVLFGMMLSWVFFAYELGSVFEIFLLTSGIFGAMAIYGATTKKDLTGWGSFLIMGLIGIVIAGIINLFTKSSMMAFIINCAGVLIFTGLTAYDMQRLKALHAENNGRGNMGGLAVIGAFTMYLNFINLFIRLLSLFGRRR